MVLLLLWDYETASMAGHSGNTHSNSLIQMWLTVLLSLLQVIPTYRNLAEAHSSAYVQTTATTKGLREIRLDGANIHSADGMGLPSSQSLRGNDRINGKNVDSIRQPGSGGIIIEPSMLDFGEQPIGMPKIETVVIHNPHPENNIRMLSISGNTPHFHSSFFQDKLVPPGGNTTFDVVFLARIVGNAENSLYIHTNRGLYPYQVFGVGIPNPYRLRPFLGARVPVNTSFSPLINMHNPFSQTIQVTEMYSSGGDLHLELPTGEREASQSFWEIPPFQTKSVMRASFVGRVESNHTAFIRIKTNQTEEEEEFVILPVEVEVSSAPGIYSSLEMLDFGTLRTLDEPRTVQIYLINTGQKPVHITSVTLVRVNEAVTIDFKPLVLKSPEKHTKVADVTFHPSKATNSRHWSGKIIIKTKEKNYRLQIPYQAYVLQGTLSYNKDSTMFYIGQPPYEPVVRDLTLTNLFNFALVIYDVSVPEDVSHIFSIENFNGPIFIAPEETDVSLKIRFNSSTSLRLSTALRLNTNASVFTIPVHCYNGTLQYIVHSAEGNQINFGTMGIGDMRSMTFTVINENPVEIPLYEWGCNIDGARVDLLGVEPGTGIYLSRVHNISEINTDPLVLPPYHYAVFRIEVIGPNQEGQFISEVLLKSPYEVISIAVIMRTADGSLQAKPEEIHFRPTFPGRLVYQSLTLLSSFKHPMTLEDIKPEKQDPRFYFKSGKKSGADIELEPMKKNKVGRVFYDAKQLCQDDCYVGLPTSSADGLQWIQSLSVPPDIVDLDTDLYQGFRSHWQEIQDTGYAISNITLRLNTNLVKGYNIPAEAQLIWPSLLRKDHIQFPLTQIGNSSIEEVKIYNPSDVPLLVQLLPVASYPSPQTILEIIMDRERFDPDTIEVDSSKLFFLADLYNTSTQSSAVKHSNNIANTFGVKSNTSTLSLLIKPRSNVTVSIGFTPLDEVIRTSLILIRNNLTILDFLLVEGQGARGEFRVSGRKPGPNSTLLFELKQSHLQDCDKSSARARSPPNFTVKRTFTTKNVGQLPIHIKSFEVNGFECEGYGFKVLNCKPYIIKPNQTYKIDIAFTPDFTLSRVTRHLKFLTTRGPDMEYTLLATIPPNMLPYCSSAIPRPPWEHLLYAATICLMITLFMGVLMVSYLEALRFHPPITMHRKKIGTEQVIDRSKRFDLRSIGSGVKSNTQDTNTSSGGFIAGLSSTLGLRPRTPSPLQNNHTTMPNNTHLHQDAQQINEKTEKMRQNSWSTNTKISHVENLGTRSSSNPLPSGNSPPVTKKHNQPKSNKRRLFMEPELEQNTINNTRLLDNEYELQKQNLVENVNLNSCVKVDETTTEQTKQPTDFNDLDSISARKTRPKQRKSKATLKREEKDRMKDKLLRKEDLTMYDHDDSSSTTTECSNPDLDSIDKFTKQPINLKSDYDDDNLGGFYSDMTTKQKSKLKKDDILDIGNLKRFENVKVKSKSRKSGKVDPKSIFNGDVLRPSTLELPYTTALEAGRRKVKGPTSPHSIAAAVAAKAMKRNIKDSTSGLSTFNVKMNDISESSSDKSSDVDKDSPPPLWDQPKPLPNTDGLQQLSIQTLEANPLLHAENFLYKPSQVHPTALTATGGTLTCAAGGSRNNSYSSVVSSTSNGDITGKSKKKSKVNKTLSAPGKACNSAFTAVGDKNKHPGAIGTKNKVGHKPSWLCSDLDSSDAGSGGSSPTSPPGGIPLTPNADPNYNQPRKHAPTFGHLQEPTHFPYTDDVATSMWDTKKTDNSAAGPWLGYGLSSSKPACSLWDPSSSISSPQASTPSWNTTTANAAKPQSLFHGTQLWDTPKSASRDNNLIPSIWTSDSIWTTGSSSNDSSLLDMSSHSPTQKPEVSGTFDPFDSFRTSIWGPSGSQAMNASMWNTNNQPNEEEQ